MIANFLIFKIIKTNGVLLNIILQYYCYTHLEKIIKNANNFRSYCIFNKIEIVKVSYS